MFAPNDNRGLSQLLYGTTSVEKQKRLPIDVLAHKPLDDFDSNEEDSEEDSEDDDSDDSEEDSEVAYSDDENLSTYAMVHYDDEMNVKAASATQREMDEMYISDVDDVLIPSIKRIKNHIFMPPSGSFKYVKGPYKTFAEFAHIPQLPDDASNDPPATVANKIFMAEPFVNVNAYFDYIRSLDSYGALQALLMFYRDHNTKWRRDISQNEATTNLELKNHTGGRLFSRVILVKLRNIVIETCIREDALSILPTATSDENALFRSIHRTDRIGGHPYIQVAQKRIDDSTADRFAASLLPALRTLRQMPGSDVDFIEIFRFFITIVSSFAIMRLGAELGGMKPFFQMVQYILYDDLRPYDNDVDAYNRECALRDECKLRLQCRLTRPETHPITRNVVNYINGCRARADVIPLNHDMRLELACKIVEVAFKFTKDGLFAHPDLVVHATTEHIQPYHAVAIMLLCGVDEECLDSFIDCWDDSLRKRSISNDEMAVWSARPLLWFLTHISTWGDLNENQVDALQYYLQHSFAAHLGRLAGHEIGARLLIMIASIPEHTFLRRTLDACTAIQMLCKQHIGARIILSPFYGTQDDDMLWIAFGKEKRFAAWHTQTIGGSDAFLDEIRSFVKLAPADEIDSLRATYLCALSTYRPALLLLPHALAKEFRLRLRQRTPNDPLTMNYIERMMRLASHQLDQAYFRAAY